jgi:catalase
VKEGAAVQWVSDAYAHLKAVGYNKEAQPLLDMAHVAPDAGVVELKSQFTKAAAKRYFEREPKIRTLA